MLWILLLFVIGALIGLALPYLVGVKRLDAFGAGRIILFMLGVEAVAVLAVFALAYWDSQDKAVPFGGIWLSLFAGLAVGLELSLFFYLCRRLATFPKVLGLGALGLASIVACAIGGYFGCLSIYTQKSPSEPVYSAFYDAFSSTDGVHLDRFSQSELLDQSFEADYSAFDEAFLEELAAEAKYAARLHFDKNLSADEKDQVVYALKSELAEEGFKRIGWREGTEIYAKSKGKKHFQSIVQFVDFDTKDPSIRYAEGLFPTDADCLVPTGKREAPPQPAPAPSRRKQSAPSSSGTSSRASTASAASSSSAGSSSAPAAPRRTASKEPTVTVTQNGDWTYTTKLYEDGHKEVTGSFFCSKCNGSGLCNICHGTGVFTISMGFTMICPHCSGLKKCIDCGGVGQTTSTTRYEKPSSSSASYSGAVPYTGSYGGGGSTGSSSSSYSSSSSTRRTCPSCNGTGKGTSTIIWETNYTGEDNSVWCSECGRSAPAHRHNHPSCPVCHGSGTVGG